MALIIFVLFTSASASAALVDDLEVSIAEYNAYSGEVPSLIKTLFGNEAGHVTIGLNDGSALFLKVVTEDAKVVEFEEIAADEEIDASLLVEIHESTLDEILNSESPMDVFVDAYDGGEIKVEATSLKNKISLTLGTAAIRLSQFVGFF